MTSRYSHLSEVERLLIESGRLFGLSYATIGRTIGRHRSTVLRECRRGHCRPLSRYVAVFGDRHYVQGRRNAGRSRRKLGADVDSSMWQLVRRGLRAQWSPQQIAGRLRMLEPPAAPPLYVSHETIYRAIYDMPRCTLKTELVMQLRQSRSGRRRRSRGRQRFVGLRNFIPIAQRPAAIEQRVQPGHWEGDLVEGARGTRAVVATLVERTSRLVRLVKLPDGTASSLLEGVRRRLRGEPPWMRRSLTYDRGSEIARHEDLARALNIDVYICDPYRPWQRGANENTNGLLRQYLPKGADLTQLEPAQLQGIENLLNNRPRRVLGYRTPHEEYARLRGGEARER